MWVRGRVSEWVYGGWLSECVGGCVSVRVCGRMNGWVREWVSEGVKDSKNIEEKYDKKE